MILEINDHKHFRDLVGSLLRSLHDSYLAGADRDAAGRRAARIVQVRRGLRPRRRDP